MPRTHCIRPLGSVAAVVLLLACVARGSGQVVSLNLDVLDPSDAGYEAPPPFHVVLDAFVDIAASDVWTAGGIRGTTTDQARFYYSAMDDPNTPQPDMLINPGYEHRFGTSLSKPRPQRNGTQRFEQAGAAVAGRYIGGSVATATARDLNVAYFASPPEGPNSPSVDGYIARFEIEVNPIWFADPALAIVVSRTPIDVVQMLVRFELPPGQSGVGIVNSTFDFPTIVGANWYCYVTNVPEPAALTSLLTIALFTRRRA